MFGRARYLAPRSCEYRGGGRAHPPHRHPRPLCRRQVRTTEILKIHHFYYSLGARIQSISWAAVTRRRSCREGGTAPDGPLAASPACRAAVAAADRCRTAGFRRDELYGLTSQLRRGATSVPSNIASSSTRPSPGRRAPRTSNPLSELADALLLARSRLFIEDHRTPPSYWRSWGPRWRPHAPSATAELRR